MDAGATFAKTLRLTLVVKLAQQYGYIIRDAKLQASMTAQHCHRAKQLLLVVLLNVIFLNNIPCYPWLYIGIILVGKKV